MRKNLFQKLKNKKGYTLTEMIVVVGIIVILLGISMIGVAELSKNLKMAELDDYAKIIYLEAQEQLSLIEVEGGTDAYYEQIRSTYPKITEGEAGYNPRFFKEEIYAVDEYVSDYPLGSTDAEKVLAKKMWEHMCYLTKSDPLSKKMIFETSDIYLNGGSYLIEFNPTTGDIYGVFYWENSADMSYKNDIMALTTRERADRKAKQIGYYGGELAGDFVEEESILQNVTLINGEELYLKLSFDKEEAVKALDENRLSVVVDIAGERNNTVRFDTIDLRVNNDATGTDTMDFYMLLDSMMEGHRFNNIVNAGKTGDEQVITPGENLTIKVTSTFKDATTGEIRKREKTVRGNSLFANNTTTSQIGISALRHMMNLNGSVYDADKFTDRNLIQYISNVDFAEDAYAWGVDGFNNVIYKKYGLGEHPLTYINPIQNEKLFKTGMNATGTSENRKVTSAGDGVRYVLKNFIVEPVKSAEGVIADNTDIGIFGEIKNTDFSKIYVENATVNAEGCDNVGALIGRLENGGILDCGVYLQTSGVKDGVLIDYPVAAENGTDGHKYLMEHYYDTYRIKGNNNVGGLIGKAEANTEVIIKNAFAATKVDGVSNVGGLIGYVETTSDAGIYVIKQSYASGDVSGQSYVGGFAGGIKSFTSGKIAVQNNYTTGNVSGTRTFGGFLGQTKNVAYSDCISYGKLLKLGAEENKNTTFTEDDNVGGFVYEEASSGSSYSDCVYMSQIGYNKSEALTDPLAPENSTAGVTTKEYGALMSTPDTAVKISYPYANILYMQAFPFEKLVDQTVHYGDWATRFVIDTSLVYYEKYADGSYGYYCVTTSEGNNKLWLLDTLQDEICVEDGYGLLTKYKLKEISYEVYIGNTDKKLTTDENVRVNERKSETEGSTYQEKQFLYLNLQDSLTFKGIGSYDVAKGEVIGDETGDSFDVKGLYLYQLPYELQCPDRTGDPRFYDRIVFDAVADGGSNKKVIEDAAYLYNPHFAKIAYNSNVSNEPVNPLNVYIRSARQLNALGRYECYWSMRGGEDRTQKVTFVQDADINFSKYVKNYLGKEGFDLQAFGTDYSNRPIGASSSSIETGKYLTEEKATEKHFTNNYNGKSYQIIDYCVDGGKDSQYVGLFGAISGATLENIVMVASSNEGNPGKILSRYETKHYWNTEWNYHSAGVGALVGLAYETSEANKNIIKNCAVSGYTVKYILSSKAAYAVEDFKTDIGPAIQADKNNADIMEPTAIVVGGLAGFSTSDMSDCSAVNDVVIELQKDYLHTHDNYLKDWNYAGGVAYLGGFVGSYIDGKIDSCYSGGQIEVLDNGYSIPELRVATFCPGWVDTGVTGVKPLAEYQNQGNENLTTEYTTLVGQYDALMKAYKRDTTQAGKLSEAKEKLKAIKDICQQMYSPIYADTETVYNKIYSYTKVSENVWDVKGRKNVKVTAINTGADPSLGYEDTNLTFTHYIPLVSRHLDYYVVKRVDAEVWMLDQSIPADSITFTNNIYITNVTDSHLKNIKLSQEVKNKYMTEEGNFTANKKSHTELSTYAKDNGLTPITTFINDFNTNGKLVASSKKYPYPAVLTDVRSGNTGNTVHYGDWSDLSDLIDASLAYYEKYADGKYGYYCVTTDVNKKKIWIVDSLRDEVCIEDGYGLLTKYQLDSLSYKKGSATEYTASTINKEEVEGVVIATKYNDYDSTLAQGKDKQDESLDAAELYKYFYKLPYNLQDPGNPSSFYSKVTFNGAASGENVINEVVCWYNPHFAKAAINPTKDQTTFANPTNVYVRSARQLNALGRYNYYYDVKGGNNNQKVTFVQENDINFSDYAYVGETEDGKKLTSYLGQEFDLQNIDEQNPYRNEPIGKPGNQFKNIYDGQGNLIIDYCVGSKEQFTGLFGEVKEATLKNIVMVVSSDPKGDAGGVITSSYTTNTEKRAGVGALVGHAYESSANSVFKNTIDNCAVSGYTVQYVLDENSTADPMGIAVGGFAGLSMSPITNCSALNDVVIKLEKDYVNAVKLYDDADGRVYLGGFLGSQMWSTVTNCYSGGTIEVQNNDGAFKVPNLRVGGFCPGWMDTVFSGQKHYNMYTGADRKVGYSNVYSYTKVSDSIWDTLGSVYYVPLVSNLVEYSIPNEAHKYWYSEQIPKEKMCFENNKYIEKLSVGHLEKTSEEAKAYYMTDGVCFTADATSFTGLADSATVKVTQKDGNTNTFINGDLDSNGKLIPSETPYPYQAVIKNVDASGNPTEEYAHYGEWLGEIDNTLAYYEKYSDTDYGYYSLVTDPITGTAWILDTLQDRVAIEDGYGLLTEYTLGSLSYDLYVANKGTAVPGEIDVSTLQSVSGLKFEVNDGATRKVVSASNLTNFYKLPFDRQFTERNSGDGFYDLIVLNATERETGNEVITEFASLYNPNFAKTAMNLEADTADITPKNVYVRSARQLNALGRNSYYWSLKGGNNSQKVTFVQETDINFSTYAYDETTQTKKYLGIDFDLQTFDKEATYRNKPIGDATIGISFRNIYDGQSNKIIDYCLDGGEDTWFTGLFGEINGATLKNIVMVVSSDPKSQNAGVITSSFLTKIIDPVNQENTAIPKYRAGIGALVGHIFRYQTKMGGYEESELSTVENCITSGYKVQYVLEDKVKESVLGNYLSSAKVGDGRQLEPLGIAIGGFVGFSEGQITNCAAVNTVEIVLEKDYQNTYDNYKREYFGTGGVVYMGGFAGSHLFETVTNCYSGGRIDVKNNGFSIPQLRVGSFCPGWLDTPIYETKFTDDGQLPNLRSRQFENIYSYTEISEDIWKVPGIKDIYTQEYKEAATYYVPLVSLLADYYERENPEFKTDKDAPEKLWIHGHYYPGAIEKFENVYYLQELSAGHLKHMSNVGSDLQNMIKPSGVEQITTKALKDKANVHVANGRTYLNADTTAGKAYPYQAVIEDVKTGNYVHYGPWYEGKDPETMTSKLPVYFEEYEDDYGFYAVKEDGTVESNITNNHEKKIVRTGYGFLTASETDANVDKNKASIEIDGGIYYLQVLTSDELQKFLSENGAEDKGRYQRFEMKYNTAGKETAKWICINPNFGAALSASEDLGTDDNPLQVRTKEQFERVATLTEANAKNSFIRQTHDVDLEGAYESTYEPTHEDFQKVKDNGLTMLDYYITYDGCSEELGCVIRNAGATPFAINNGLIRNTRVVSYDSTGNPQWSLSGFVFDNIGTIENCSVEATAIKADCAYGFVIFNAPGAVVNNCSVTGNLIGTEEAIGFVADNRGLVEGCNVNVTMTARDAFGFAEMNRTGATITKCEATVNATATKNTDGNDRPEGNLSILDHNGLAAGFMEQNAGLVSGCKVYLDATHSISSNYIANGFAYINFGADRKERKDEHGNTITDADGKVQYDVEIKETGTIEDCHVVSDGNGSVEGRYAYGFVYKNPNLVVNGIAVDAKISGCSVIGSILGDKEAAGFAGINEGEITLSKVGKTDSNVTTTIQAREPAGFVFENSGEVDECHVNANVESTTNEHRAFGFTYANKPGGQITYSSVTGTVKAKLAYGFVLKNNENAAAGVTATIAHCSVNATVTGYGAENKGVSGDDGVEAAGFCDRNYSGGIIKNCSVAGTIRATMTAKDGGTYAEAYSEAVGFIDVNKGTVTSCTVGNVNSNEFVTVIGDDAAGFVEKNEDGATISKCSVVAKVTATGNGVTDEHGDKNGTVSGFAEHNKVATISECTVYLADRDNDPVIEGSREAYGFAEKNEGAISNSKVIATGKATIEGRDIAVGFVKDNGAKYDNEIKTGTIKGCHVGDKDHADVLNIQSHSAYGFTRTNLNGSKIEDSSVIANVKGHSSCDDGHTNCHVVGVAGEHVSCSIGSDDREATGFVDYNYGEITNCKVGDKDNDVLCTVEARDAYGFAEKNMDGGSITNSSVFAKMSGTNQVAGFIEENGSIITNSQVYLKDSGDVPAIYCEEIASGFATENIGTIQNCVVQNLGKGSIIGEDEADGFVRYNGMQETEDEGTVVKNVLGVGISLDCHVGDRTNSEGMIIQGKKAYGFAKENNSYIEVNDPNSVDHGKKLYSEMTGCSVVAQITTFVDVNNKKDTDAAYGMVGTNWGKVTNCHVGVVDDTDKNVKILIEGSRAYGFIRENRGSITGSSVVGTAGTIIRATASAEVSKGYDGYDTGLALGFASDNYGTIENSYVRAMNGYRDVLIQGEQAYGFVKKVHHVKDVIVGVNKCFVVATIEGQMYAAGFAKENETANGIINCYSNANVSVSNDYSELYDNKPKASGFIYSATQPVINCYACGSVSGHNTYGFTRMGFTEDCYTVVIHNGKEMHGFRGTGGDNSSGGISGECYWAYDATTTTTPGFNLGVEDQNVNSKTLQKCDEVGADTEAEPFDMCLGEMYPYKTYGLKHYGDWPITRVINAEYSGLDLLRAGLYYCEEYTINGEVSYGIYAVGDVAEDYTENGKKKQRRALATTVNSLMMADPITLEQYVTARYYGVYYHDPKPEDCVCGTDHVNGWFPNTTFKFEENEPYLFKELITEQGITPWIPPGFTNYKFCRIEPAVGSTEKLKSEVTATIFYQNDKNVDGDGVGGHADTNYDHLFAELASEKGITVDQARANGITLTITLEEVEIARFDPKYGRPPERQ